MTRMTIRMSILLLAGLLAGDVEALAVAASAGLDPRDEAPALGNPLEPHVTPHLITGAQPAATTAVPAPAEPAPPSGNPLWAIPLRQLTATRERPLFAPSRRPPAVAAPVTFQLASVPPAPPPRPPEPERPQLSLVGTVAAEGGGIGVFLDSTDQSVLRLKTGENHKGWILRSVGHRKVVLAKGFTDVELTLPAPDLAKRDAPQAGVAAQSAGAPQGKAAQKASGFLTIPPASAPPPPAAATAAGSPGGLFGAFAVPTQVRR